MKGLMLGIVRDKSGLVGVILLTLFLVTAVGHTSLTPIGPKELVGSPLTPPGGAFVLGTDYLGRDLLSRLISGTRPTLLLAIGATGVSLAVGIVLGAFAGYFGGRVDALLSRLFEVVLTVPRLFLIILLVAMFGSKGWVTVTVIGATIWPSNARLIRSQVLSIKERPFVSAARVAGLNPLSVLFKHVVPNGVAPIIANTTLQMAQALILEANLSFLGLGDPNRITWGQLVQEALRAFQSAWWGVLFPGIALSLLLLSLHLIGDSLNRVLNPRKRGRGV